MADEFIEKSWQDATGGKSYIEGLNYSADHKWTYGIITVRGTRQKSEVELNVIAGGKCIRKFDDFSIKDGETKTFRFDVNAETSVSITGCVKNTYVLGAGADIHVQLHFDGVKIKSVEKSWHDSTGGASCIEGLGFDADHHWEKCSILVKGDKNKETNCLLTLLVDGDLMMIDEMKENFMVSGTASKLFEININKRASLLVAGYIGNKSVVTGAGATVILTATYKEV